VGDDRIAAACLLAALGREDFETDKEYMRAYTGALLLAGALSCIREIVKAIPRER
jgi:hypothetical protein